VSKVAMPRPRYIAFRLAGAQVSRRAFANALRGRAKHEGWAEGQGPHLTRYAWPHGIVRVEHTEQAKARELLGRITWAAEGVARAEFAVETVGASGTLKALTGRVGFLQERDEKKPA
jgi:RNase P/RNase MRP subunit POP5